MTAREFTRPCPACSAPVVVWPPPAVWVLPDGVPAVMTTCGKCRSTRSHGYAPGVWLALRTTKAQREATARWLAARRCERANEKLERLVWSRAPQQQRPAASV